MIAIMTTDAGVRSELRGDELNSLCHLASQRLLHGPPQLDAGTWEDVRQFFSDAGFATGDDVGACGRTALPNAPAHGSSAQCL
jgi:hypothetical protein